MCELVPEALADVLPVLRHDDVEGDAAREGGPARRRRLGRVARPHDHDLREKRISSGQLDAPAFDTHPGDVPAPGDDAQQMHERPAAGRGGRHERAARLLLGVDQRRERGARVGVRGDGRRRRQRVGEGAGGRRRLASLVPRQPPGRVGVLRQRHEAAGEAVPGAAVA